MKLITFWLPVINFLKIKENIQKKKDIYININQTQYIDFCYQQYHIIIDSLGFFYVEYNESKDNKILDFIIDTITQETKELINTTFLNKKISCNSFQNENKYLNFIQDISFEFELENKIILNNIKYSISSHFTHKEKNNFKEYFKFDLLEDDLNISNIINRNFIQLIEKSLFFTKGLEYEKGEIYPLNIFNDFKVSTLIKNIKLIIKENKKKISDIKSNTILNSIVKKAIQDSIEEKTILNFLEKTRNKYLKEIFIKLSKINESIEKLNYQILALEFNENSQNSCNIKSEEDIEIFIQHILQTIPRFKEIDIKVKTAYYIKIGNVTTSTKVSNDETIQNTLFYQRWYSAIKYFEDMANEIKEILIIYHQNKSYKELENINYFENYKSDLEDIRNINEKIKTMPQKEKQYIEILIFIIALTALTGEAPLVEFNNFFKDKISFLENITINILDLIINVVIYSFILISIYLRKNQITNFLNKYLFKEEIKDKKYFLFDEFDYDKHEHRSNKALFNYNLENNKTNIVTISYNELSSAYDLMKKLKNIEIHKYKNFKYNLFPHLLRKPYSYDKNIEIYENYRISRTDKVNSKFLFRYKITNFTLKDFISEIEKDNFLDYYESLNNKNKLLEKKLLEIDKILKTNFNIKLNKSLKNILKKDNNKSVFLSLSSTLPRDKDIKLTFYIVYSFNLKLIKHEESIYYYNVFKDQFRVHYHINKLPYNKKEDIEINLEKISKLIYIYFLARVKNFDYINQK